ncbi:MAG TPA: ribosomal protein S18-alanine N-acetyltransferase [Sphingomonadales bacterium]|nr:ribosomal protein S18-alanine N-acetyltransferase [Sphingomonadales bacterium]
MADIAPLPAGAWAEAYAVHAASFAPEAADFLSPHSFAALAAEENVLLLGAREAKAWVGYILLRVAADEAEILSLAVNPKARKQGLGKKLVMAAIAAVRGRGVEKIFLEVSPANAAALSAYRAAGFQACGVRKAYYRPKSGEIEDALTMVFRPVN